MVNRNQKSYDEMGNIKEVKNLASISDTDEIVVDGQKYKLVHVIVHIGMSTGSGHYVTYNLQDMTVFDDSPQPTIKPVKPYQMNVAKLSGYIFEYEKIERLDT